MVDESRDEHDGSASQASGATVAGGIESTAGPAGTSGPQSVGISGADLAVEEGPRGDSGSALDAGEFEAGAAESGGTGGANAGGAG